MDEIIEIKMNKPNSCHECPLVIIEQSNTDDELLITCPLLPEYNLKYDELHKKRDDHCPIITN